MQQNRFGIDISLKEIIYNTTQMHFLLTIKPQLRNIASSGEHLRICVDSGGCSGFEYKMTLDNDKVDSQEDEVLRPADGVTIVVDKVPSFPMLLIKIFHPISR
jgi:Fe-S cluster assembly iron-binding protein IscA